MVLIGLDSGGIEGKHTLRSRYHRRHHRAAAFVLGWPRSDMSLFLLWKYELFREGWGYKHTGCSETTFWLLEGAAGLVGCMVTVLAFQPSVAGSLAGADLKKLKLNIVVGRVVCV